MKLRQKIALLLLSAGIGAYAAYGKIAGTESDSKNCLREIETVQGRSEIEKLVAECNTPKECFAKLN